MPDHILGIGVLNWDRHERISDRYGTCRLFPDENSDESLNLNIPTVTKTGSLIARVLETRQSRHIGDLFRGFRPTTPNVGEEIVLGIGKLFYENDNGMSVGVKPKGKREHDWLDPEKLYRAHSQTVELVFRTK